MSGLRLIRMLALVGVTLALPVQGFSLGRRDAGEQAPAAPAPAARPSADVSWESEISGQIVELSGRVRLVGSEPFPELVLTDEGDHTWYIDPADRQTISAYEQQTVTIRGTVELKEMVLANGRSLGSRRTISGIALVKVW
ncbi:hypothetical protein AGMMS50255_2960 [Spirochaetia bacterium]|nr:hypothetical protein AGMMS50255_2960 [Spirochaetia bacterium]